MPAAKHNYINWIHNLRLIALFAVIVLHTTSPLLSRYNEVPAADWMAANIFNSLVRFAVPVFVMITGALLLHREYEVGDFLKKRLSRIIAPFLFWSLVYIGYSWYNEDIVFTADAWANTKQVLHLLKYGSSYHLWYVYMLIGLYLIIPVISGFVRNASNKEVLYFLLIWFGVTLFAQPYLLRYNPQVDAHYFAGYIGYLVLGHWLAHHDFKVKHIRGCMVALFIVTLLVIIAGTHWQYKYNTGLDTLFYEPISPPIILLSSSVFLIARFTMPTAPTWVIKARDFAGHYNYGIYLGHALVLYGLDLAGITYKLCNPIVSIPLTAFLCFNITLLMIWLLSKLPFGRWIAGN